MLKLKYINDTEEYQVEFSKISKNICQLKGEFPVKRDGFFLSRIGENDNWDYTSYKTIYRQLENAVQFSNNGSTFIPTIKFNPGFGELQGELTQMVNNYEDLQIPITIETEFVKFLNWEPEIPSSGIIDGNVSFYAMFELLPQTVEIPTIREEPTIESRVTQLESDVDYLAMCTDIELGDSSNE